MARSDEDPVYVRWFRHWKTGKIIRKKNGGVFKFYPKRKKK